MPMIAAQILHVIALLIYHICIIIYGTILQSYVLPANVKLKGLIYEKGQFLVLKIHALPCIDTH